MQKKIPFGAAIAHGYNFVLGQFINVSLLILAPLVIAIFIGALGLGSALQFMSAMKAGDPAAWSHFGPLIPVYVIAALLHLTMFTMTSEYALGLRQPSLFGFPFGKPVWRVIGAIFLAALAIIMGLVLFGLAIFFLTMLLGIVGSMLVPAEAVAPIAAITSVLTVFFVYGAIIYAVFRLTFLIVPLTLMLQRIDLYESWRLTKGNFWRILGIFAAIFLPFIVVEYALIFAAIGFPPALPDGASQAAQLQASMAWNIAMFQAIRTYWYITIPFLFAATVFICGAFSGAQAFAYRALTEGVSAPVASDSLPDR